MTRFAQIAVALLLLHAGAAYGETTLKVGWCARTVSSAATPFAIATKLGWFAKDGIKVDLAPLPGSTDCVKLVATGAIDYSLPSIEPLAIVRPQGVKAKVYYTAYQGNIYGIAVPADSPIKTEADLRGKNIGVTSMSSAGVLIARAIAATNGLNPDKDMQIVVAGEGAQTAALLRSKDVDALSQFDTQYTLVENAGMKLRRLENKEISRYPSNGFLALEETLRSHRKEAVALARGYAMGTIFAMTNPEAAVRILYEVYPQTKPTGKDEPTAIADDVKTLLARAVSWDAGRKAGRAWGENSISDYAAYVDFMLKWDVIKQKVDAQDLVTNDLIAEINAFDAPAVEAQAKAWK
ncbi:MAG TPA: ABC transporter substrate-binding protein [Candidatus Cybelea sp.]|nr:ABC transporter substrate-binding protein [Candidatus Cybelea sp.]